MKRILSLVTLTVFAACFASCAAPEEKAASTPAPSVVAPAESNANAEQEVRRLQQEYDKTWVQQDVAAFERLLADEVTQIDSEGKVLSKAEIVTNARTGAVKFEMGQSEDIKVRVYGNTAILSSRWTEKSINKGKPIAGTMQNLVVWVKKNGNWQVVSDQVTVIVPPKPKA